MCLHVAMATFRDITMMMAFQDKPGHGMSYGIRLKGHLLDIVIVVFQQCK